MKATEICLLVATTLGLAAGDNDTEVKTLDTLLTWIQVGSSQDQWLEHKSRLSNEWDRVALVFGYVDDFEACSDVVDGLIATYPKARYRCVPAN